MDRSSYTCLVAAVPPLLCDAKRILLSRLMSSMMVLAVTLDGVDAMRCSSADALRPSCESVRGGGATTRRRLVALGCMSSLSSCTFASATRVDGREAPVGKSDSSWSRYWL